MVEHQPSKLNTWVRFPLPAPILLLVLGCLAFTPALHAKEPPMADEAYRDIFSKDHSARLASAATYATTLCDRFAASIATDQSKDHDIVQAMKNQDKIAESYGVLALKYYMHIHPKEQVERFRTAVSAWSESVEKQVAAQFGTQPRIKQFLTICYDRAQKLGAEYDPVDTSAPSAKPATTAPAPKAWGK